MLLPQVTHISISFLCGPDSSGYRTHDGSASSGDYTSLPISTG